MTALTPVSQSVGSAAPDRHDPLMKAAQELEVSFLAQMLEAAGLGRAREGFGGGAGEEQFGSFLVKEQARHIVNGGGIGLAQSLFDALKERSDGI